MKFSAIGGGCFIFFYLYSLTSWIHAQDGSSLEYKPESSELFANHVPVPPWLDVVVQLSNPDYQYHFLPKAQTPFLDIWGWKKIDLPTNPFDSKETISASPNQIKEGWVYSTQKVTGLSNNWLYSPTYSLFFNPEGILHLTHFFENYLGTIPRLIVSPMNTVKVHQFVRLIVAPDEHLTYVDLQLPSNMILAYKMRIKKGTGEAIYVIYIVAMSQQSDQIEVIKGISHYDDGTQQYFLYRVRSFLDSSTSAVDNTPKNVSTG